MCLHFKKVLQPMIIVRTGQKKSVSPVDQKSYVFYKGNNELIIIIQNMLHGGR